MNSLHHLYLWDWAVGRASFDGGPLESCGTRARWKYGAKYKCQWPLFWKCLGDRKRKKLVTMVDMGGQKKIRNENFYSDAVLIVMPLRQIRWMWRNTLLCWKYARVTACSEMSVTSRVFNILCCSFAIFLFLHWNFRILHATFFPSWRDNPLVGLGLLIHEVCFPRLHTTTHHSQ